MVTIVVTVLQFVLRPPWHEGDIVLGTVSQ